MLSSEFLLTETDNQILSVTLNRPEKHNCFGIPELEGIQHTLRQHESNPGIRAVVFRGAGERSFSTGADLNQFTGLDTSGAVNWIKKGHEVFNEIDSYPKPTVAVVHGYALGGGLELALCCDFRIASENAVFGSPELRHGWLPGWGGIHRLQKLLGQSAAKKIVFLAEHISAKEAFRLGLVHQIAASETLEQETHTLLDKLLRLDPDAFSIAKAAFAGSGTNHSTRPDQIWFDILGTLHSKRNT